MWRNPARRHKELKDELSQIVQLIYIAAQINVKGFERMAADFSALQAAMDDFTNEVSIVVEALQNPAVDNNETATIQSLTAKLQAGVSALKAAVPAPAVTPAPTPAPASTPTTAPAPASGSGTASTSSASETAPSTPSA